MLFQFLTQAVLTKVLTDYVASIGRTLPKDVANLILQPLGLWKTRKEAKLFREEARKAMQSTRTNRGGWFYIHYGNCGVQSFLEGLILLSLFMFVDRLFLKDRSCLPPNWRDEASGPHHTCSDAASDGLDDDGDA